MDSIFGTLFVIDSEILILSLYEVLEIGLLLAILINMFKNKLISNIDFIGFSLLSVITVGVVHVIKDYEGMNYILIQQSILPLMSAFIIYESVLLIKHKINLELIFNMFIIFTFIVLFEYIIGRLNILPDSINYYIFNYRNAYRSIFVSSDLLLSLILIVSALINLYKYKITHNILYLLLFIGTNYLLIETFNRTPFFALVIVTFILAIYYKEFFKLFMYVCIVYFVLMPISKYLSATQLPKYVIYSIKNSISIDTAYQKLYGPNKDTDIEKFFYANEKNDNLLDSSSINHNFDRQGGYFSHTSLLDRLGASLRGIDVLIYTNYLGSGPGQSVRYMVDNNIPSYCDDSIFLSNENIKNFYNNVKTGQHVTNTHMLYTNLLAEYGVIVIVFYIAVLYKMYGFLKNYMFFRNDILSSVSVAIVVAYGMYYSFQVVPILLSILLFFINVVNYQMRGKFK